MFLGRGPHVGHPLSIGVLVRRSFVVLAVLAPLALVGVRPGKAAAQAIQTPTGTTEAAACAFTNYTLSGTFNLIGGAASFTLTASGSCLGTSPAVVPEDGGYVAHGVPVAITYAVHDRDDTWGVVTESFFISSDDVIDIGRPRWREDPRSIIQNLDGYLQIQDPEAAPDRVFERAGREAERLAARASHAPMSPHRRGDRGR